MASVNYTQQELEGRAWHLHNVIAFMSEALPADSGTGLPVQSTLVELRTLSAELATAIGSAKQPAKTVQLLTR